MSKEAVKQAAKRAEPCKSCDGLGWIWHNPSGVWNCHVACPVCYPDEYRADMRWLT